jgi:hypothetical protein
MAYFYNYTRSLHCAIGYPKRGRRRKPQRAGGNYQAPSPHNSAQNVTGESTAAAHQCLNTDGNAYKTKISKVNIKNSKGQKSNISKLSQISTYQ